MSGGGGYLDLHGPVSARRRVCHSRAGPFRGRRALPVGSGGAALDIAGGGSCQDRAGCPDPVREGARGSGS